MDTHLPDDLNELEKRLARWEPAPADLAADRMLFAAGQGSVRPGLFGRLSIPAAVCLAALSTVLGIGLALEREERLALARALELAHSAPHGVTPGVKPPGPAEVHDSIPLSPASYLAARSALERGDPDLWLGRSNNEPSPSLPAPPVLHAWRPGTLVEP